MTRRMPRIDSGTFELVNDRHAIDAVRDQIVEGLEQFGYTAASAFAVRLAFEEAVSNAFRHGHRQLPGAVPARVRFQIDPNQVEIEVEDRGPGFTPAAVPDPTLDENLESPSGRGLMLIRAYMASVEFSPSGNRIRMLYRRPHGR